MHIHLSVQTFSSESARVLSHPLFTSHMAFPLPTKFLFLTLSSCFPDFSIESILYLARALSIISAVSYFLSYSHTLPYTK